MKRTLIFGLSVALLLSLAACGKSQADQPDTSQPNPAAISTQADVSTTEPLAETEPEPPAQTQAVPEQLASTTQAAPNEADTSQPPEETAPPELFTEVNETVYAISEVNIRASWSANSDKLGSLTRGQSVTRTGTSIAGTEAEGWSRVQLSDGTIAYISNKYLSTTKPTTQSSSDGGGTTQTTQPASQGGGGTATQPPSGGDVGESLEDYVNRVLAEYETAGTDHVKPGDPGWDDYVKGIAGALNP